MKLFVVKIASSAAADTIGDNSRSFSRSKRRRSSSSFCSWIFRLMSSRIRAVCSTTRATGSDEKEETDGGCSMTLSSSDVCGASGGKFVIGDIGASLKIVDKHFAFLLDYYAEDIGLYS